MKPQFQYIKPFLILLNILPERIYNIKDEMIVETDMIPMNEEIIFKLRKINNG
jgi:hypothetical protein